MPEGYNAGKTTTHSHNGHKHTHDERMEVWLPASTSVGSDHQPYWAAPASDCKSTHSCLAMRIMLYLHACSSGAAVGGMVWYLH